MNEELSGHENCYRCDDCMENEIKALAAKQARIEELEAKYARARESDLAQSEEIAALKAKYVTPEKGEKPCGHNHYWTGAHGTCMVCRAEKAESERDQAIKALAEEGRLRGKAESERDDYHKKAIEIADQRDRAESEAARLLQINGAVAGENMALRDRVKELEALPTCEVEKEWWAKYKASEEKLAEAVKFLEQAKAEAYGEKQWGYVVDRVGLALGCLSAPSPEKPAEPKPTGFPPNCPDCGNQAHTGYCRQILRPMPNCLCPDQHDEKCPRYKP